MATQSPSMTLAPTLLADWAPSPSECCSQTDDCVWVREYNPSGGATRTVVDAPSQTTNSFPSTWRSRRTYAGSTCPSHYSSACQDIDGAMACCPTVHEFGCKPATWDLGAHGDCFRCVSAYTSQGDTEVDVTRDNLLDGGISEVIGPQQGGDVLSSPPLLVTTLVSTQPIP
ncbi:hypothetical protein GGR50DRAFT_146624 [Xylaria sp. CBS 124048]|nr:hypothetical protein GGR50DRAFT_146624 [Xylaria sp. CBS 124048]